MLSMVGGALKKINGVRDPDKLGSHCHMKEKDPVLQYQPTPIHVLKAKSVGRGVEYDPVSNFSASSRITLPSSTKRSHSSDAMVPTKRSKLVVDNEEIEAKFSDSDEDRIVDRTIVPASGIALVTDCSTFAKNSEGHSLPSSHLHLNLSSTNKQTANLQRSDNSSPSKTSSRNLTKSATTTKLAERQFKPKDSAVNCLTSSQSQTNLTVSSYHSDSSKSQLPYIVLKEDDNLTEQLLSNFKTVVHRDNKHTDKVRNSSSGSKNISEQKITDNRHSDGNKTLKTKDQHSKADSYHSCDITGGGKQSNSDHHKRDRSSSQTKSGHVNSSTDSCRKSEAVSETYKHSGHKHSRSEQSDKKVAASSSHRTGHKEEKKEREKHVSATSAHKTTSSESPIVKGALTHDKKHKTFDKESKHRQTTDAASGNHLQLESRSHTESLQSKTSAGNRSALSAKDSKSSQHKHSSKHRESISVNSSQHKKPVASCQMESSPSKTVTSESSTAADMKYVNATRNIELFGVDSDTESDILKSSPVKQRETVTSKSAVSRHRSSSSDEVILLSTDDVSGASDNDDTFEQCQRLYNKLSRQQQLKPAASTTSSTQSVS